MNYKKLVKGTINQINDSEDCIWYLSENNFLGMKRLYFKDTNETKRDFIHYIDFDSWSDMYIYLKGFQKGANSLKPF